MSRLSEFVAGTSRTGNEYTAEHQATHPNNRVSLPDPNNRISESGKLIGYSNEYNGNREPLSVSK